MSKVVPSEARGKKETKSWWGQKEGEQKKRSSFFYKVKKCKALQKKGLVKKSSISLFFSKNKEIEDF